MYNVYIYINTSMIEANYDYVVNKDYGKFFISDYKFYLLKRSIVLIIVCVEYKS